MDQTDFLTAEGSRQRTRKFLEEWPLNFDEFRGNFVVPYGSTRVWISFQELDDGGTTTTFTSWLVSGVEESSALYRYVATQQPALGQLALIKTSDGALTVTLSYAALSDYMIATEFQFILSFIATTGDDLDDEIQSVFGGRLAIGP